LEHEIAQLEAELNRQAAANPYEATYQPVPGVGFIRVRVLSNEFGVLTALVVRIFRICG
jgi:hypothetical protein